MKRIFISLGLLYAAHAWSIGPVSGVDAVIQRVNPQVNLGAVVVDLTTGDTLYQRNATRLYLPASNMKLFSEAAVLLALGADYRFKNQLSTDATQLKDGVLRGNLYLRLSGDPSFSRHDLRVLLSSLREWKVRDIQGTIYIDSSLASVDAYPPGWLTSDKSYSYGAPVAPFMLDNNRLNVLINPGAQVGAPALIEPDDVGGLMELVNQVTTKTDATGCSIGLSLDAENHVTARGCVGLGQGAAQYRMAVKNPLNYAQSVIFGLLEHEGIAVHGHVQLGTTPEHSLVLATQYSKPLTQLMADTLKPSDNLYADSLYLHAAGHVHESPVNWPEAQAIIKTLLQQQTGIDLSNATFADGSGLSRYNLVTPQQTSSLLLFLAQRFPLAYEYIAALPVSGRDGTLQKRFKTPQQQGFIRAKTGTMTGVNSLSGYLYTMNGHTLAFTFYINRIPGSNAGPGRPVLDALCAYFLGLNPEGTRLANTMMPHVRAPFQGYPTYEHTQRTQQAKWRQLESGVRLALKGQNVQVVYHHHELIIQDKQGDANKVWQALKGVAQKHSFAAALISAEPLLVPENHVLWVHDPNLVNTRTWIIRS